MRVNKAVVYLAWFQALVATVGSLFSSEVLLLVPCVLCWYQRIFMFPLVFIIAVGILRKDKNMPYYALPLSIVGMAIAFYQNLLQWGIIREVNSPCSLGVPCVTTYAGLLGFITLPLLSFAAFTLITACMLVLIKRDPVITL